MANVKNIEPHKFKKGEISSEEAAKRGRAGGKKSAAKRKENKLIRERILERMGESDWDEYIDGIIARAKDSKADAEFLRDTIGQKPSDKVEVSGIAEEQSKLDEILKQRRSRHAGK